MREVLLELCDKYMDVYKIKEIIKVQEIDWEKLCGFVIANRMIGISYKNLKKANIKIPGEIEKALQVLYEINKVKSEKFKNDVLYISKLLNNVSFPYALLKGAFLTTSLYDAGERTSNDIDILVESKNVTEIQNVLLQNGFVQGWYREGEIVKATRQEVLRAKMNYGETVPFIKLEKEKIEVDLNFSVDYKPGNEVVAELLNGVIDVPYNGKQFKCLNTEDFLIHLCCHLYKEATTFDWVRRRLDLLLYKFSDINVFVRKYFDCSFAHHLKNEIYNKEVKKECYYALENTSKIYPNLNEIEGFQNLKEAIRPHDLKFMNQIVFPSEKKLYQYNIEFIDWFFCDNRTKCLEEIG